jgi:peroxiredoxin family protein
VDKLKAGMVGNPAAPLPHMVAGLPGMESFATMIMKKKIQGLDIPDIRELLETLDAAGADLYACKMAMDMFDLERKDLVDEVKDVIGAMDFFQFAEGAQTFFI